MLVKIDDKLILDITETIFNVIRNEISDKDIIEDIERRLQWIIIHKFEQCFQRLKAEWDPKLAARGIEMIPTNKEKYAELVFSQPDYKSRSERDSVSERVNNVSSN